MIRMRTILEVADNTGARKASCIGVVGRSGRLIAEVGDIISANIKESTPDASVKQGEVVKGVIVRTKNKIRRSDGTTIRFDNNALVIIDTQRNPKGTRIFGPVPRELRDKGFMKIISVAPEVI